MSLRKVTRVSVVFLALLLIVGGIYTTTRYFHDEQIKRHAVRISKQKSKIAESQRQASKERLRTAARVAKHREMEKVAAAKMGQNHIESANQYAYPVAQVKQEMDAPYTSPIKEKVVFLTFDDGPNTVNSPKVLDILSQAGVHGTFFVVGKQVSPETAPVLKAEYDAGHAIGLHSQY